MKPSTRLTIAGLLSAAGAFLSALANEFSSEAPASAEAAAAPTPEPAALKAKKTKAEKPAPEPEKVEEPATPAQPESAEEPTGKSYEELRALIKPLVEGGQGAEVKAVIGKYAASLKEIQPKDHAAFEKDLAALSY